MQHAKSPIVSSLTYAGSLPFVIVALLTIAGIRDLPLVGNIIYVLQTYGLVIASFMAGTYWGQGIATKEALPINVYVASNVLVLALWVGFLISPMKSFIGLLMIIFPLWLWIDYIFQKQGIISRSYWTLRFRVTMIVLLALLTIEYYLI